MKKTLLALSVLVASTAANAGVEIYNKDGATVNLSGDMEVKYVKSTAKDASLEQAISDADFSFDVRYAVNDDLSVGGVWKFEGDSGNTVGPTQTSDAYFAFYTADMGTLIVGDTVTMLDDAGIGSDQIFGISTLVSDASVGGDELVKYTIDKETFYFGAAFMDNQKGGGNDLVDFKAGVRFGDLDVTAFYGTSSSLDQDIVILEARYALDAANLEAGYYAVEDYTDTAALAADYTMNKWTFATGLNFTDFDDSVEVVGTEKEDYTGYFVNASYAIATSTTLYVEVAGDDRDTSDEVAYGFGAELSF